MDDLSEKLKAWAATHNARREWALYEKTGNGAHAWRAYREYRRAGLREVPDELLAYLDRSADGLEGGGKPSNVKQALDLAKTDAFTGMNVSGRGRGYAQADDTAAARDIVEYVVTAFRVRYRAGDDPSIKDIRAEAAERFGRPSSSIKVLLHDWGVTKKRLVELSHHR